LKFQKVEVSKKIKFRGQVWGGKIVVGKAKNSEGKEKNNEE
jgi:hypothetical protein